MVALTLLDHVTRQKMLRQKTQLRALRDDIDLLDRNILLLIAERQQLVERVGMLKKKKGQKIYDPAREKEILLKQLSIGAELGLDPRFVHDMCNAIFQLAKSTQRKLTKGIL
jgi:chorismate mutase